MQAAIKTGDDQKLKKEADELDNFFSKIEDMIASCVPMDQEEITINNTDAKRQEAEQLLAAGQYDDAKAIAEEIHAFAIKAGDWKLREEMEYFVINAEEQERKGHQEEFEALEERRAATEERSRQEAKERARLEVEERARLEKLKKIVKVSKSLLLDDLAQALGITRADLLGKIFDWAETYGFEVDGDRVVFGGGQKNKFIADLEQEFAAWGKDGKT